ncbi:MAG: poly-gamma-glutamate system protein [Clostridia bacterium]|nr:poly-gamma-glutamate system protein [Clostridia bacterium]
MSVTGESGTMSKLARPAWGARRGTVSVVLLLLSALIALMGSWGARLAAPAGRADCYDEQVIAAEVMQAGAAAVRDLRLELGISIDPEIDPNGTGLIGDEFTLMTTSVGVLEAKRTSTNPAFAAVMVKYFREAGLAAGDVVAVGSSGSFPALILATLSAARALDLEPVMIYSVGASMYGANIPELTFVPMLARLNELGIIPYKLEAVSLGGESDQGGGAIFGDGRPVMEKAAMSAGVPVIREPSVSASIAARHRVFEEAAARVGRPISCFVNVGGATANYGNTSASLEFPNGLVMRPPVMSTDPERGLIFEFAAAGVPVINLLDVRGLAMKNGLPVDPVPLPGIGEGGVYRARQYSRVVAGLALIASLAPLGFGLQNARKRRV